MKGLAYVDFSDDAHLAGALAKNRQMLLGKKLSIARSNPNKSRKDSSGRDNQMEHVHAAGQTSTAGGSATNESAARKRGGDDVQIKGKNTFAVPRNVRALGWTANKPKTEEGDEKPKSNDEFRKMFMKS